MSCERYEEEALLRLEQDTPLEGHFHQCPDCARLRAAHQHLKAELAHLPPLASPPTDWEARVWARIHQREARPRRWAWGAFAGFAASAAALALALVVWHGPQGASPALRAVVIERQAQTVRGISAHPGDLLRLDGTPGASTHRELRVYRDGRLSARCSDQPPCVMGEAGLSAEIPLEEVGRYEAVLIHSDRPIPAPGAHAEMSADLNAALAAGASVVTAQSVDVY